MDKFEFHRIFKDLPSRKFHSCILSSFSFDYNFFDIQIRRQLQRIGIMNTIVLVDARQLDDGFAKFSQNTTHLLKDYTVIPVENKLCFHPKVMMFFGEENIAMHVGSGNLTSGGLGKNHEMFSTLICDSIESNLYSVINCGANYLLSFLKEKKGFVLKQIDWIKEHCDLLDITENYEDVTQVEQIDGTNISYISNQANSIYNKLLELMPVNEINEIDIVSPYFDKGNDLTNSILNDFPKAVINVFLQNGKVDFKFDTIESDRVNYYDWTSTEIGKKKFKSGEKYNHSKIFIFKSSNRKYTYHGSANATNAAFGLGNISNNEAGLLIDSISHNDNIGLSPKEKIDTSIFISKVNIPSPNESIRTKGRAVKILGADMYNGKLEVYLSKEKENDIITCVDSLDNIIFQKHIESINEKYIIADLDRAAITSINALYIKRDEVKVSNVYYPSKIDYLLKCNPSKENRKFQKFLFDMEAGNTNSFEIVSRLELLLKEKGKAIINRKSSKSKSRSVSKDISYTYEDALRNQELNEREVDKNIKSLHQSFELLFHMNQYLKEDKSMDQDEGGVKKGGGNIDEEKEAEVFQKKKAFRSIEAYDRKRYSIYNYFISYANYLRKISQLNDLNIKADYEITSSDMIFSEQSFFHLLSFADKNVEVTKKAESTTDKKDHKDNTKGTKEETLVRKVLPLTGLISNKDSFISLLRMLIGEFSFYLMGGKFIEYQDKYSKLEQEKYRTSCKKYFLTSICIYDALFNKDAKDAELWYSIGKLYLGEINESDIEEVLDNSQFTSYKQGEILNSFNRLRSFSIQTNGQIGHYLNIDDGLFLVNDIVPSHNPTIFKLRLPGIEVLESSSDLIPFNYFKPQNKWLRSKKQLISV